MTEQDDLDAPDVFDAIHEQAVRAARDVGVLLRRAADAADRAADQIAALSGTTIITTGKEVHDLIAESKAARARSKDVMLSLARLFPKRHQDFMATIPESELALAFQASVDDTPTEALRLAVAEHMRECRDSACDIHKFGPMELARREREGIE
jgi:hypothetical protein